MFVNWYERTGTDGAYGGTRGHVAVEGLPGSVFLYGPTALRCNPVLRGYATTRRRQQEQRSSARSITCYAGKRA
eukprot:646953-Rhodomonas_salina.1